MVVICPSLSPEATEETRTVNKPGKNAAGGAGVQPEGVPPPHRDATPGFPAARRRSAPRLRYITSKAAEGC